MYKYLRYLNAVIALVLFLSLIQPTAKAYAGIGELPRTEFGSVIDARVTELAPGAQYTWYDMATPRGKQQMHFVEFDPTNPNLALRAGTKDGKVYGMKAVTEMAAYADAPGNRVIAGINGDFFEISGNATGVPNGLFMEDGRILNSASSSYAFGLKADGTSIYGTHTLTRTVTIGGVKTNLTHINRFRGNNQLVLYTADYSTSTKSSPEGDEVVLDIIKGEIKSGQTLTLKVADIRKNQGDAPLRPGQAVLSASGTSRSVLENLKLGDEVTAYFELSGEWQDVVLAIGGYGPLVKDGVPQTGVAPEGVHPRTAIGTKADGSIVLFEIDGRAPGFSEGVETNELAKILKDIGVVQAMNLDGGGSSTFAAKLPGTNQVKMLNRGSDGAERKTGNGLLLVNTAPELGIAAKLAVQPNAERVLAGSSFAFAAAGVDANGHPASVEAQREWEAETAIGSIDANGIFTAGESAGIGKVTVRAGEIQGTGEVEVVKELDQLKFPDTSRSFTSGATLKLSVTALRAGQLVQADNKSFEWRTEGDIGTISDDGVFSATENNGVNGKIYARYGGIEASMEVSVGLPPVILEDFEKGLGKYQASGAQYKSVKITAETNQDFVRNGSSALKLEYDFTGTTGTSGAYLSAPVKENRIQIPGYPEKIGMWVYGDGKKHWLRGQIRDGSSDTGAAVPLDFTEELVGVDWVGWKYVEAVVPKGKTLPLTMDQPVRYMETSNLKKDAGAIYIDDIRAIYGPLNEDRTPPVISSVSPAEGTMVMDAHPTITIHAADDGYDPVVHPGTTLIDPEKIRVYVDGELVEHGLYPPEGRITYTPLAPLSEGRHSVKAAVRDMSGNQTIKEWSFTVNLGSPYYSYETPAVLYAGNTYSLDIHAAQAETLAAGRIAFQFDVKAVSGLRVVRGEKLTEAQLKSELDPATGIVNLTLSGMEQAEIADEDLIGQIQYTVNHDYIGPLGLEQVTGEGEVSKPLRIAFLAGEIVKTGAPEKPLAFYGNPVDSQVQTQLKLTWDHYAIGLGYPAEFLIQDMQGGAPVEGAKLLVNGVAVEESGSNSGGLLVTDKATQATGTYQLQAVKGTAYSPVMTFKVAEPAFTASPVNMNVTMGADPSESRRFNWQTHPDVKDSVVELVKEADFIGFDADNIIKVTGSNSIYNTNSYGTYRVHKAEAAGLEPGTSYVYRVGDGKTNVSGQGKFVTSEASGDITKFLFFGDSQADSEAGFGLWRNTLNAALKDMPDAEFLVHAGDMVDKGFLQQQWNWWFGAAQDAFMNKTLVPIIGNHEVMGTNGAGDYLAHFNNPQNGADSVKGSNFSFDVKDTHFVVMNTELSQATLDEQALWLDEDLASTDKQWKIIMFHQGPYGSIYSNLKVQAGWVPIFDKHQVDLVLNGHDHVYMRSYLMKGGEISEDGGTRYVIGGSSGPKFYGLTERFWQEKIYAETENIYTAVEITPDTLTVVATTVDGLEIDRLVLEKQRAPDSMVAISLSGKLQLKPEATDQTVTEAVYASGKRMVITEGIVYASSNEEAAVINETGLVTALAEGKTVISATYEGFFDSYELEITSREVVLDHLSMNGPAALTVGKTGEAAVTLHYSDGTEVASNEGVTFTSSNPDVADILETGIIIAKQAGTTMIRAEYLGMYAELELTVARPSDPDPDPGQENSSGPDQPSQPEEPKRPGRVEVKPEQLLEQQDRQDVVIKTDQLLKELVLTGRTMKQLKTDGTLTIQAGNLSITIPRQALEELTASIPADQLDDSVITLLATPVDSAAAAALLADAGARESAKLRSASEMLEFSLTVRTKAGETFSISEWNQPLTISLLAYPSADRYITAIYSVADDGSLAYWGGAWEARKLTVSVNRLGKFAVLEYSKSYTDLPTGHWAATAIKRLTALHLIQGVSKDRFAPDQAVTRAEFTSMLVRALKLSEAGAGMKASATDTATFADVPSSEWFAEDIALAVRAGLVKGKSETAFAPDQPITRQEMAVIIIRAYEYAAGKRAAESLAPFADLAGVPAWAQAAIGQAYGLGLLKGHSPAAFGPSGNGTRAQSAQLIWNLISKLP